MKIKSVEDNILLHMRNDYQKLQEGIHLLKQSVFKDSSNAPMFSAMARERAERIRWCRQQLDILFKLSEEDRESIPGEYWIERRQKQLEEAIREEKRFIFYAKLCKGQASEATLDIEGAKEVPIETLIEAQPKGRSGGRLFYLCPFHEEHTASFVVDKRKNRFTCYGCGAWGSVIDIVMKLKGIGFVEAVKELTYNGKKY